MTTIAYDGKVLAGDQLMVANGTPMGIPKVHRIATVDGTVYLVGGAGNVGDCQAFAHWVRKGLPAGEKPKLTNCTMLVVCRGKITQYDNEFEHPSEISKDFWAVGSGANYALGVMAMGGSAQDAVRLATTLDINTGWGMDVVRA